MMVMMVMTATTATTLATVTTIPITTLIGTTIQKERRSGRR